MASDKTYATWLDFYNAVAADLGNAICSVHDSDYVAIEKARQSIAEIEEKMLILRAHFLKACAEETPESKTERTKSYVNHLVQKIIACLEIREYDEAQGAMDRLMLVVHQLNEEIEDGFRKDFKDVKPN